MNRRRFLLGATGAAGAGALASTPAWAVPDEIMTDADRVAFPADEAVPTIEQLLSDRGVAPAYAAEVEKAKAIIEACPVKKNPVEIAQYFQDLRQGQLNAALGADAHHYGEEWPVRANPLIVQFFDATTLRKPAGDTTAWCAAFVNWCIARGRKGRDDEQKLAEDKLAKHTQSAASSSFREWGNKTDKPEPGDIVVFRHRTENWRGHVGFVISKTSSGIQVLGGNQMPLRARLPSGTYDRPNKGEVNVSRMQMNAGSLEFHSFRTHPSLHDL
jgi:uncharacterized protein (TIGR02594 family)